MDCTPSNSEAGSHGLPNGGEMYELQPLSTDWREVGFKIPSIKECLMQCNELNGT